MNDEIILNFIASWNWFLISVMCLLTSIILISIPHSPASIVFALATFLAFFFTGMRAFRRRNAIFE